MLKRDKILNGSTPRIKTGCGWVYITVNLQKEVPFEVIISMGKGGGCASAMCEALGRTLSLALQSGAELKDLVKTLMGICCPNQVIYEGTNVMSCADAVSKVLKMHISEKTIDKEIT